MKTMKNLLWAGMMMLSVLGQAQQQNFPIPPKVADSLSNSASRIIFKIGNEGASNQANQRMADPSHDLLKEIREEFEVDQIEKVFQPTSSANTRTFTSSRLNNIYQLDVDDTDKARSMVKQLNGKSGIVYAELYTPNELLYIPNDPLANPNFGNQDYLANIKAFDAWGVERSDSSMTIAIVDTGVDLDHSDLAGSIQYNYNDPVNGLDDDKDGYIDNFAGWDVSDFDNDVSDNINGHGTIVAGMSSAHTNNYDGIAGTGFNARMLPVKILSDATNRLIREYEGIVYAVDHGARVINLSWGGAWNYSEFGKDVIDYAVIDNDVVVIAAAGNTHAELDYYPASYDNVLSVAASTTDDELASWATYSHKIDIMAPGHNVFSLKNDNKYGTAQGSSFAAPLVAGTAALVRSKFPHLTARQVIEQIRVTSDDVSDLPFNQNYQGKIGKGRLNMHRALTDSITPSLRLNAYQYNGSFGDKIFSGDTITIYPTFINYLHRASNVTVTLKSANDNTIANDAQFVVNNLETFGTTSMPDEEGWKVIVKDDVEPGSRLLFKVEFEANGYSDYQYFELYTTPGYFDVAARNMLLTVTSDGDLGYDNDTQYYGNGVWFGNQKISDHLGVMISSDGDHVIDNIVNMYEPFTKSQDFRATENVRLFKNSLAETDARTTFHEYEMLDHKLGVQVEQKVLSWPESGSGDYFVIEYRIVNTTDKELVDLNLGMYIDWDLADKMKNSAGWNTEGNFAWARSNDDQPLYSGLSLLSEGDATYYAFDLENHNGNMADFNNFLTDAQKHQYASSGLVKTQAGLNGGNNIAHLVALNKINIQPKGSKKVAFVMAASEDEQALQASVENAQLKYEAYLTTPPVDQAYFTCKGDNVDIDFEQEVVKEFYADAALKQRLDSAVSYHTNNVYNDTAVFFVKVQGGIRSDVRTVDINIREPLASFKPATDTLFIENNALNKVEFINETQSGSSWQWDFGNGYKANVANPTVQYDQPGSYEITLVAQNELGCIDTVKSNLFVAMRSEKPAIQDQLICKGTSAVIRAVNADQIRVYEDAGLQNPIFEGSTFQTQALAQDMTYFVTNVDGWESLPESIDIKVSAPDLKVAHSLDTTDLQNPHIMRFADQSNYANNTSWMVDGVYMSAEHEMTLDYSGMPDFEIQLSGADSMQCKDSVILAFQPAKSVQPEAITVNSCAEKTLTITPTVPGTYYFYADAAMNNLLHKGSQLRVDVSGNDSIIYYTAMDKLLESDPGTITIDNFGLKAKISPSSEFVNLHADDQVVVYNESEEADWSYWYLPTGTIDMSSSLTKEISGPGAYPFTLVAGNHEGCVDTAYFTLEAQYVTGLNDQFDAKIDEDAFAPKTSLYPNPASDRFEIAVEGASFANPRLSLFDIEGNLVMDRQVKDFFYNKLTVNASSLPSGMYFVVVQDENLNLRSKISIKH